MITHNPSTNRLYEGDGYSTHTYFYICFFETNSSNYSFKTFTNWVTKKRYV